jgi:protein SCO1/2
MKHLTYIVPLCLILFTAACNNKEKLPIYGGKQLVVTKEAGKKYYDSVDYSIGYIRLYNQNRDIITRKDVEGKIYVADFFFTACPGICPKMKAQLLKVYEKYKDNPKVIIVSYTIDPKRDTPETLLRYAEKLQVKAPKWHFLTGNQDTIYALADKYLVSAKEDPDSPGGFAHSGNLVLVDELGRIRGYYDGTTNEGAEKLLADMDKLLAE